MVNTIREVCMVGISLAAGLYLILFWSNHSQVPGLKRVGEEIPIPF